MRPVRALTLLLLSCLAGVPPAAPAAPPQSLAAQRADLAAARAYVLGSRSFSPAGRAAAAARLDAALRRPAPLDPAGFLVETLALTALAGNGHDFVDTAGGWQPGRRLPLHLLWLADGLVVARTPAAQAGLRGARVIAIDGHDEAGLLQALRRVNGGNDAYRRWNAGWLLEHPEMLHAMGLAARPDRVRLTVRRADGSTAVVTVPAVPSAAVPADLGRTGLWSRTLSRDEQAQGWTAAVAAAEDPLWLQAPDRLFRLVDLPALDALYIQFRANHDGPGQPIAAFVAAVHASLASTPRRHLIVDQRLNSGGNADLTEDLMREIAQRRTGRIAVLVGPQTFSAGIVSTALVVHGAGERALLVGSEVGDRLRWWSEGGVAVCLPNARYCLHGATGLWDLVHGCAGEAGCYGDRFDARVPGLAPALPAPLTAADWAAGRDPAMEAVARALAQQALGPDLTRR